MCSGWSPIPSDSSPESLKTRDHLQRSRDVSETELVGNHSSSMYLSLISKAAMGSLHYTVEAKDKWPEAKPQSDNF